MAGQLFDFEFPDRFVAGTVGQPGERTFYLQATAGARVVSVALEKVQVALLAEKLEELLDEVRRRQGADSVVPAAARSPVTCCGCGCGRTWRGRSSAGRSASWLPGGRHARFVATRSTRKVTCARARTAIAGHTDPVTSEPAVFDLPDALRLLRDGELSVEGRLYDASNATETVRWPLVACR